MNTLAARHPETAWYTDPPADREWMRLAACRGWEPELWFPRKDDPRLRYVRDALEVCRDCPVQHDCLHHALRTDTRHGIWGGATASQRARLTGRRP